jgi:hypothetical protein
MSFDELLRQGQAIRAEGDARRETLDRQQVSAQAEDERFRDELRQLGKWFALTARARDVPRLPLVFIPDTPAPAPAAPTARRGWFRRAVPAPPPERPAPVTTTGWALFHLDLSTGQLRPGASRTYGGRKYFDTMVDEKGAFLCLAVAEDGEVYVGQRRAEGVWVYRSDRDRIMGARPEELTPGRLLYEVADVYVPLPRGLHPLRPADADLITGITSGNKAWENEVLAWYVAGAQYLLEHRCTVP